MKRFLMCNNPSLVSVKEQPSVWMLCLAHLLFIPLGLLALCLYQERLFGDSGWYLFRVINTEQFVIEHNRPSLYLWQWFVLLLVKCSVPMGWMLRAYSVYHVLFFYGLFVFIVHKLKDFRSGLFLLLMQLFGVSDLFIHTPMWELWYGLAMYILLIALWRTGRDSLWVSILLTVFVWMSYPFNIVLWGVGIVLVLPWKFVWENRYRFVAMAVVALVVKVFFGNAYESGKMTNLWENGVLLNSSKVFSARYLQDFLWFYLNRYPAVVVGIVLSLITLRRKPLLAAIYLALIVSIAAAINLAYGVNGFGSCGSTFEAIYYLIPLVTLFVLVYRWMEWDTVFNRGLMVGLLVFITVWGVCDIVRVSDVYRERTAFINRTIDEGVKSGNRKIICRDSNVLRFNYHYCFFSYPMESMLLSAIGGANNCVSISEEKLVIDSMNLTLIPKDSYLSGPNEIKPLESLNRKYFSLPVGYYKLLNKGDFKQYYLPQILNGTPICFLHSFETDRVGKSLYSIVVTLAAGDTVWSRNGHSYWQVKSGNIIHSKQPVSADAFGVFKDYIVVRRDSLSTSVDSYLSLVVNNSICVQIPLR